MRDIIVRRMRALFDRAKAAEEFVNDDLLVKTGLRNDPADHPNKKNSERNKPRPPATPCAWNRNASPARTFPPAPLVRGDPRQQERVDDRTFDEKANENQGKHYPLIAAFPCFLFLNFS